MFSQFFFILISIAIFVFLISSLFVISRFKVIPSDKVIVIFGKVGKNNSSICQHGGARFIWPLIQGYKFLDLTPMTIDIFLENALSKQNIRVSIPSRFTIGISTDPVILRSAAERLLSMKLKEREDNARDIIFGQLRATIATMDIEEINADREAFELKIMENVEGELRKIGLRLINVNITDISDESGYINALGRKAASEAINKAKVEVAEQNRKGAVGEAEAKREERISVARANATAIEGENISQIAIVKSEGLKLQAEAESKSLSKAAALVQEAKALEEGYESEKKAELTRKAKQEATQMADIIVPAEINKRQIAIEAEAEAVRLEKIAEGEAKKIIIMAEAEALRLEKVAEGEAKKVIIMAEAEALKSEKLGQGKGKEIQAEMTGRAEGNKQLLLKQAEGLQSLVSSIGDPKSTAMLMIIDKLPTLVQTQVEAVKNLNIDKITVWDSGIKDANGNTTTSNFVSSLVGTLPPVADLIKSAGFNLNDLMKDEKNTEEK